MAEKVRVSAKELVKDIKDGLTDDRLAAKYDVSPVQLDRLFAKLVERGIVTQSELDARRSLPGDSVDPVTEPSAEPTERKPYVTPESHTQEYPVEYGADHTDDPVLKQYGRYAALGIALGLLVQIAGAAIPPMATKSPAIPAFVVILVGMGIFVYGCYCLMKMKGQHGALALLGLLGCFGLVILLVLPNKHKGSSSNALIAVVAVSAGLVALVFIGGIVLSVAIPYYVSYKRTACDRAVAADVGRLTAALLRLENEAEDRGMEFDERAVDTFAANNGLKYLVGPYYGWGGCTKKCRSLIRLHKHQGRWVVEGAAVMASRPRKNSRYVYRSYVTGGDHLPAAIGTDIVDAGDGNSLHWNSYPAGDTLDAGKCYKRSILGRPKTPGNREFTMRPPRRSVPCGSVLKK